MNCRPPPQGDGKNLEATMPARAKSSRPARMPSEGQRLAATALFLMTEYIESRRPMLAAMVAGELLAIEREAGANPDLAAVVARLRYRWWQLAQNGGEA